MKIKKLFTTIAILFIASNIFAAENKPAYADLMKKAKDYESKEKYVYALATYWDAVSAYPDETAIEAMEAYISLQELIEKGIPGRGEYDEFSIYDGWINLLQDAEAYFSETPNIKIITGKLVKGELNYENRTASYSGYISFAVTEKFKAIISIITKGADNTTNGKEWIKIKSWPRYSVYEKGNSNVALAKLTDINSLYWKYHFGGKFDAMFEGANRALGNGSYISPYIPAWNIIEMGIINKGAASMPKAYWMDVQCVIKNQKTNAVIATLPVLTSNGNGRFVITDIDQATMKVIDNNDYYYSIKSAGSQIFDIGYYEGNSIKTIKWVPEKVTKRIDVTNKISLSTNLKEVNPAELYKTNIEEKMKKDMEKLAADLISSDTVKGLLEGKGTFGNRTALDGTNYTTINSDKFTLEELNITDEKVINNLVNSGYPILNKNLYNVYHVQDASISIIKDGNRYYFEILGDQINTLKYEIMRKEKEAAAEKRKKEAQANKMNKFPIQNAEIYKAVIVTDTNAFITFKNIEQNDQFALRIEGNTGITKTKWGWYEASSTDENVINLLKKGTTLSFTVNGDGSTYSFVVFNGESSFSYKFRTKKGAETSVTIPLNKLSHDSWTPNVKFNAANITQFRFKWENQSEIAPKNKDFGITITNAVIK